MSNDNIPFTLSGTAFVLNCQRKEETGRIYLRKALPRSPGGGTADGGTGSWSLERTTCDMICGLRIPCGSSSMAVGCVVKMFGALSIYQLAVRA